MVTQRQNEHHVFDDSRMPRGTLIGSLDRFANDRQTLFLSILLRLDFIQLYNSSCNRTAMANDGDAMNEFVRAAAQLHRHRVCFLTYY